MPKNPLIRDESTAAAKMETLSPAALLKRQFYELLAAKNFIAVPKEHLRTPDFEDAMHRDGVEIQAEINPQGFGINIQIAIAANAREDSTFGVQAHEHRPYLKFRKQITILDQQQLVEEMENIVNIATYGSTIYNSKNAFCYRDPYAVELEFLTKGHNRLAQYSRALGGVMAFMPVMGIRFQALSLLQIENETLGNVVDTLTDFERDSNQTAVYIILRTTIGLISAIIGSEIGRNLGQILQNSIKKSIKPHT